MKIFHATIPIAFCAAIAFTFPNTCDAQNNRLNNVKPVSKKQQPLTDEADDVSNTEAATTKRNKSAVSNELAIRKPLRIPESRYRDTTTTPEPGGAFSAPGVQLRVGEQETEYPETTSRPRKGTTADYNESEDANNNTNKNANTTDATTGATTKNKSGGTTNSGNTTSTRRGGRANPSTGTTDTQGSNENTNDSSKQGEPTNSNVEIIKKGIDILDSIINKK